MEKDAILHYIFFKIIRISGLIFLLGLILTALSTGQAEVSYRFWEIGTLSYLVMLVLARFGK